MVTSPPDHPATGKCSKVQMDFIRKVKTQIKNSSQASIPYLFEPPPIIETGQKPKAEPYYINHFWFLSRICSAQLFSKD